MAKQKLRIPVKGEKITAAWARQVTEAINWCLSFSATGACKYDSGINSLFVGGGGGSGAALIAKTPVGGIGPRTGFTLGKAVCTRCELVVDGDDLNVGETESVATLYNLSTSAVGAESYVIAVKILGHWVVIWEDCV